MKTLEKTFAFFLFILGLFAVVSCGTATTQLQVLQPAELTIPDHIEVIATLDRSRPRSGFRNAIESIFTGESIGQDRRGRESAIDGLINALTRTPRFQVKSTGMEMTGSRNGNRMEAPLAWSEIKRLTERHDVDAILAIESFDSDSRTFTKERKYTKKVNDVEVDKIEYNTEQDIRVRVGWRLYDPKERIIIDEFTAISDIEVDGKGDTKELSIANLPDQIRVVRDVSYDAGVLYGMRIAPVWITVNRTFYKTSKKADKDIMQKAARYAKSDNWEAASKIWKSLINQSLEEKTPGKAAHNLAVAAERLGKLEFALDWAKKAFLEYGNKSSRDYIQDLEQRLNDKRKVKRQMGH